MKYLLLALIAPFAFASCAGLDGTTLKFEGGVITVQPPPGPIVIPVDTNSTK